jgi:choline dehydrogenase-like flavoprotein
MAKTVYDVCIVGSGAGGGTLAGHLAQRGVNVAIIEGGPVINTRPTSIRTLYPSILPTGTFRP